MRLQEGVSKETGMPPHVLIMEDEFSVAKGLEMVLTEEGYRVDLAMTGQSALDTLKTRDFDLLVADLRLPDIDGMQVVREVKTKRPETQVIVITGYASVLSAVDAMKAGVSDYLPKPFTDDQFMAAVAEAMESRLPAEKAEEIPPVEEKNIIQKREVLRVLNRTADDRNFWNELMESGSDALDHYNLSPEAKAAIASGDLRWLNEHVGELTQKQLMFIQKRLEREVW